jgi:hypothetical protein
MSDDYWDTERLDLIARIELLERAREHCVERVERQAGKIVELEYGLDEAREALRDILESMGARLDDARLDYIIVQLDRATIEAARAALGEDA